MKTGFVRVDESHTSPRCSIARILGLLVSLLALMLALSASAHAAGDANMATCPNEATAGFRTALPDCRAYEIMSPSNKAGGEFQFKAGTSDGSRLLAQSLNATGSVEGDNFGAIYLMSRTMTGWETSAINPPAWQLASSEFAGASTDLSKTLWKARNPPQSVDAVDLYLRAQNGALTRIGPLTPPSLSLGADGGAWQLLNSAYQYVGGSADLTHNVVSIDHSLKGMLWPNDPTALEGRSLYEYVNVENLRPELVGVSDGSTVVDGKILPEGEAISACSTDLGSLSRADTYNAISADADRIFFTAKGLTASECEGTRAPEVSELYARLGHIETLPISQPTAGQCEACKTDVRMPAEFAGASEDGSKVFFLTEQELLPGAATRSLYEYDFHNPTGAKVLLVTPGASNPQVQGVARVSEDGSHVYFVAEGVLAGANAEGNTPSSAPEAHNLYVFERDALYPEGRIGFVATLSGEDAEDWRASDVRRVQATPDGRYLVFESAADLTSEGGASAPQVFEYDSANEELARVSVAEAGYADGENSADTHESSISPPSFEGVTFPTSRYSALAISADGATVLFTSKGGLTKDSEQAASANAQSVYEYHSNGKLRNGAVHLVSDGKNTLDAEAFNLDATGNDVIFATAESLLQQDTDTQFDIYDARIEGGFSAGSVPTGCTGETCLGEISPQPTFGAPASLAGPGESSVLPSPPPSPVVKKSDKAPSRRTRLAQAIRACKRKHGHRRVACEKAARRRFGVGVNRRGRGH